MRRALIPQAVAAEPGEGRACREISRTDADGQVLM